jgi:hypothetical protein
MLSGLLWPIHLHPKPDELLSSWLVRLAHGHGMKAESFTHLIFGGERRVWNRDIDRSGPNWLIETLATQTATPIQQAKATAFKNVYECKLYLQHSETGALKWITLVNVHSQNRKAHGQHFCPQCLAKDETPYFRKAWRVALYTFCPKHNIMMHDSCPQCGLPVVFHRREMGRQEWKFDEKLSWCTSCGFDLSLATSQPVHVWHQGIHKEWKRLLRKIDAQCNRMSQFEHEKLLVLHQFCKLLRSKRLAPKLMGYVCDETRQTIPIALIHDKFYLEQMSVMYRHQLIGLAWWLLQDWPHHLRQVWKYGAVRYNVLTKDMDVVPEWYAEVVEGMRVHYLNRRYSVDHL